MTIQNLTSKKSLLIIAVLVLLVGGALVSYRLFMPGGTARTSLGSLLNTDDALVPEPPAGSAEITITADGFSPQTAQVSPGWLVTWTNTDSKPHHIAADPYPFVAGQSLFDSESLSTGDTFSYLFSEPGTYTYYDYSDPLKIKGTILVK